MRLLSLHIFFFFFFNDTATTEIYTLSLHDALPISLAVFHAQRTALDLGNGVENLAAQRAGEAIADGRAAIADHADIKVVAYTLGFRAAGDQIHQRAIKSVGHKLGL